MDTGSPSAQDEVITSGGSARRATTADAAVVAKLLHDFNTEFSTPTPDVRELQSRLTQLLAGDDVVVLLIGEPASGVAVLSFRPNVWYRGPVAILDELYVRPELRGHRLGSALLDAAAVWYATGAVHSSRSMWTARTPVRAVSMKHSGSPTPNPTRQTQCCTTIESSETGTLVHALTALRG